MIFRVRLGLLLSGPVSESGLGLQGGRTLGGADRKDRAVLAGVGDSLKWWMGPYVLRARGKVPGLALLGRKKKCYECGGDFDIKKCSCGRSYCAAHGFGGRCFDCQGSSIGTVMPPLDYAQASKKGPAAEIPRPIQQEGALLPNMVRASFEYDLFDVGPVRENLILEMKRYRLVRSILTDIHSNHEIAFHYNVRNVVSRVTAERTGLQLVTDLRGAGEDLEDQGFAYLAGLLHNEILFMCELVARSLGASITNLRNDHIMEDLPPGILQTCPWCGTICRGRKKCPTCDKEIPDAIALRPFLKMHARRQLMDKLIMVKGTTMNERAKASLIAGIRARLKALEQM